MPHRGRNKNLNGVVSSCWVGVGSKKTIVVEVWEDQRRVRRDEKGDDDVVVNSGSGVVHVVVDIHLFGTVHTISVSVRRCVLLEV